MTATAGRVAGWYDDDADAAVLRYWDGTGWTPHTTGRPGEPAHFRTLRLSESAGEASDRPDDHEPDRDATRRIEPREHTTVPTSPAAHGGQVAHAARATRATPVDDGSSVPVAASARPVGQLTVVGAVTAGASLVVACAALAVALGR